MFYTSAMVIMFTVSALLAGTSVHFSLTATTGDDDFDLNLRNINVEAQQSLPAYYSSMRLSFGASSADVDRLLYHHGLSPADAFMAFRISIIIGKPIDHVVVYFHKHKAHGWGAVAKSLGIKPGSPAFHQLKQGSMVVVEKSKKQRTELEIGISAGQGNAGKPAKHSGNKGGGKGKKK